MKSNGQMRPQDIVILLKIVLRKSTSWRYSELANELDLSQSEVSSSLERSVRAGLIDVSKRVPQRNALLEFIVHGLKYVFPAIPGPIVRGIPTAHSTQPLCKNISAANQDKYVWPHDRGLIKGQSIQPLYPGAPAASQKDKKLHELLALVDALRVGRSREKNLAQKELSKRLGIK